MKTLVIAEKPSVAKDIAAALGVKKSGSIYENDQYVISNAVGHLAELQEPEGYDKKYRFWSLQTLPIMPEKFQLKASEDGEDQMNLLRKLLARKDVENVINACDAGREGELIFAYILDLAGCTKPVQRLWMQSMTKAAIVGAFKKLRPGSEMRALEDAARCRSEADWLIGMNGTRAVTRRFFGKGEVASVGRVQTPTLCLVVERERAIRNFVPRTFWRVKATFELAAGTYEGVCQRADFRKSDDADDKADRFWQIDEARRVLAAVAVGAMGVVSDLCKRSRKSPPRLYDLTTLQREANKRFGLSATRTLQIAQALYEKHKAITYPRTDSRALPEDYIPVCQRTLGQLEGRIGTHARKVLDNNWVVPNKTIFNNAQISDHFAIIPTGETANLQDMELRIYEMIAQRFVAVFFPAAEFDETQRTTEVAGWNFQSKGKVLVSAGWLEVYEKAVIEDDDEKEKSGSLPGTGQADGQPPKARTVSVAKEEDSTRPPPRYTEATLLGAMETAGKLVGDDELAAAMKESGLGTPATRANIIEELVKKKFMERSGRDLLATFKAELLMDRLRECEIEVLTQPALTGNWEKRLHEIELGKYTREAFMKGIRDMTTQIVESVRGVEVDRESPLPSPANDGTMLREKTQWYESNDGTIRLYKTIGGRLMSEAELLTLLRERRLGPLEGFRSRFNKPFKATLVLKDDHKVGFEFEARGASGEGEGEPEGPVNPADYPNLGTCPKCKKKHVRGLPRRFVCEGALGESRTCDFTKSRLMLQKQLSDDDMRALLKEGRTPLIEGFISNRTKRPFSAFLVFKGKSGDVGFEFPPREPRGAKAAPEAAAGEGAAPEAGGESKPAAKSAKPAKASKAAPRSKRPAKPAEPTESSEDIPF